MADDIANKSCSYRSSVDTSRPFSSVKEAVAIFGERFLLRDIYHSTPHQQPPTADSPSWKSASASPSPSASPSVVPDVVTPNDSPKLKLEPSNPSGSAIDESVLVESVRRLEAELEETKAALKQLKEQGSETEIALASLNAELHMNMARMAQAEAAAAKKAADGKDEAAAARDVGSPTLAQILNLGSEMSSNGYYSNKKMKADGKKKKPIVPLVGDFLYWKRKKDSRSAVSDNPLYGSPNVF
ncbi:unnamed protein product [Linum tenue]|uniref:Uncharacterized protein n=1 Tax=Linum tenue TaxID=586396 RepID=A0AAV0M0Y5_9ROSI|nr:unnamed protein product [Linum tenue]